MPGISGFSLYLPPYRVNLEDWCAWTGEPWAKVGKVVGRSFRMRGPEQDVYCLAANAVLRLIQNYAIDPARVGMLALGTESSADNSAGAVIVKGLVDQGLRALGQPALANACEVPEYKHACLGGVYALKGALRYAAGDGAQRLAIVVSADIAEYARGSSGEPTQGAGAVAMLVEAQPKLLEVDLAAGGSASSYRVVDFRKPFTRFAGQRPGSLGQLQDVPVFNGRYSTTCYVDAVRNVMANLLNKQNGDWADYYHGLDAVFMHRPYHRMPENGWGMAYLFALASDADPRLAALAADAGVDHEALISELRAQPDVPGLAVSGQLNADAYPLAAGVLQCFRRDSLYAEVVSGKLELGAARMQDLGNLYTAALPAWLAAGLEDALTQNLEKAGQIWLAVGYGSGDAAEAIPMRVADGWQAAAQKIRFGQALGGAVDLDAPAYAALHAGEDAAQLTRRPQEEFVIESVGERTDADYHDAGIAYHRYVA